jgi:hypothetical protein
MSGLLVTDNGTADSDILWQIPDGISVFLPTDSPLSSLDYAFDLYTANRICEADLKQLIRESERIVFFNSHFDVSRRDDGTEVCASQPGAGILTRLFYETHDEAMHIMKDPRETGYIVTLNKLVPKARGVLVAGSVARGQVRFFEI